MDDYYAGTVRRGRTRDGRVYMPPFEGTLTQEAIWSIRTYLEESAATSSKSVQNAKKSRYFSGFFITQKTYLAPASAVRPSSEIP